MESLKGIHVNRSENKIKGTLLRGGPAAGVIYHTAGLESEVQHRTKVAALPEDRPPIGLPTGQ